MVVFDVPYLNHGGVFAYYWDDRRAQRHGELVTDVKSRWLDPLEKATMVKNMFIH